ncbi:MAG: single-stranded DNA-binding protein [Thermoplasmataceae archaeon]|jgi:replication factor A1
MDGITKIKDLNPESRRVNVLGKVISVGEPRAIQTRFGEEKSVTEVYIGDDTGKIILSLWGDQANQAASGKTLQIDNGYISLVRGHMRLNVGKYGSMKESDEEVSEVNESFDLSEKEHENTFRNHRNFGGGNGGRGRSYYGGNNRGGRGRDNDNYD